MIRLFAVHPTAANILMLALLILGLAALPTLQRDTFPLTPPSVVEFRVGYPGASPAEVETGICQVAEDPLRAIDNLNELSCLSRDNMAVITAEIIEGRDMTRFHNDLKAAIDGIGTFPDRADDPITRVVERVASVASVAVTGPQDPKVLLSYADTLAERLRADPAISQVSIAGFSDREIAISFDAAALERHGVSIADISPILTRNSLDMPAGSLAGRQGEASIRFLGEKRSIGDFSAIVLTASPSGASITLGEVATITEVFADPAQAAYYNGKRAAIIQVSKTAAQDALRVKAALNRILEHEQAVAPGNIELAISQDSTMNIRDRLRIIAENGVQGLILVFAVMWLFFGFRFSFWVAMGLPVSFLGTIFVMQLFGFTINMMTMVALLVAIGLLMDDAIVISENIVRRRQAGETAIEAAVNGARQVAPGVVASFLTTVMIVGPLAFMDGRIGAVLKYIPIVLVMTLIVSLIEAFLILPHHMRHSLSGNLRPNRLSRAVNAGFTALRDRVVVPLSGLSLRYRYFTLGLAGFLVLFSLAPYTGGFIKYQSFPQLESDTVEARLLLVQGSPLERTEQRVAKVVKALDKMNTELTPKQPESQPLVQSYTVTYSANADTPEVGAHMATISAKLLPAGTRNTEVTAIIDRWKKLVGPMPDMAAFRITDKERGAGGKPIDIRLQGENLDDLRTTAKEMRKFFRDFEGVRDVSFDLQPGKSEFIVTMRPSAASALGVSAQAVATELRAGFRGDTPLEVRDGLGPLDVVARLSEKNRTTLQDILGLRIPGPDGALIPLTAVADVRQGRGFAVINRVDGQRTVAVQGSINPSVANARELMMALKADYLPKLAEKRPAIAVTIMGEAEDTATTGSSLTRNMLIGLIGVYLILAFQFRSFIQPAVVVVAIPLSLVGVMWGHMALGLQISLPSLVGLATLAGVVVNDSILLAGFMKDRLAAGEDMIAAGQKAVRDRFRAIFLTSLTTVVGLGPLLFEQSTQAQFLRPIVASLAFGLTAATLLALFVTPAALAVLQDLGLIRASSGKPEPPQEPVPSGQAPT
ncbi:efflux RND transporter permease subunit [Alisedimentitalea sp. MJ-SS2]|uniref:efflux RND transporter permease subunit n=1 Tax=Aliisedimentitalea sp. MJ-SS2 TaxID=3049795 RepID=UPI00290A0385|nr:efflux RND transporter permease subunit [Alisedimentitalea sp. MJ-SS2]MDU8926332.1 efflux RND transporter permease subunit [Alisedimentitalea sp. MJ-SS2]